VSWGASYGPRTTNGEWWRLVTSTFVHPGFLALAVNLAALISVGLVLERLVGHVTFAAVYAAAAVFGGVADLSSSSVSIHAGGTAAILGLYGLLLASWTWGTFQHATTTIRLRTITRLVPAAAVFLLYHVATGSLPSGTGQAGLVTGFVCGLLLTRSVWEAKPPVRRIAITASAMVVIAVLAAAPLRGMIDVRPEVAQLVGLEQRLSRKYEVAVRDFTRGLVPRTTLVQLIEGAILPGLQEPRRRIHGFGKVPPEHRPLVAAAESYLRLRDESWRLRAAALRQSNSAAKLRQADELEKAALDALQTIRR